MKRNLAVIGSTSMVGSQFCEESQKEANLIKGDLPQVDITSKDLVENFFKNDFDTVILFSAFTDVNAAERQRKNKTEPCWQVNVQGTKNVADACRRFNRKLISISTDFVFDGASGPYSETDSTGPDMDKVSWYGITKIEAEKALMATVSNYIILRIAYPYSGRDTGKDDLVLRILKLYQQGNLYPMYVDQTITPTYIPDIAPALLLLLKKNFSGIIHLASPQPVSQYEFARVLIEKAKARGPHLLSQKSVDDDLKKEGATPRPKNSTLKVDKIKSFGFTPTDWHQGIDNSVNLWLK